MPETHIYILCDMEGITNAVSYERDVFPDAPNYEQARQWLTDDLKAAMAGAREAGADGFTLYDMHFHGTNVFSEQLDPPFTLIEGKPEEGQMREGMAGLFLVGFHAMAGNERGVLPHTYNHPIRRIELNGLPVGEIGLEAAGAGSYGIPLGLVVGDREGCEEAKALLGDVETADVKWLDDRGEVALRSPDDARRAIREAAARAVARANELEPFHVPGPCELRIRCEDTTFRDGLLAQCGGERVGDDTLILRGPDARSVHSLFRKSQARQ